MLGSVSLFGKGPDFYFQFASIAECRTFKFPHAKSAYKMPVAQTPKDSPSEELSAAPSGHTELLQHQPCFLWPDRAGPGS